MRNGIYQILETNILIELDNLDLDLACYRFHIFKEKLTIGIYGREIYSKYVEYRLPVEQILKIMPYDNFNGLISIYDLKLCGKYIKF